MSTPVVVLTTFALGYVLAIVLRTINAIIAPNLVADVGLDASALGLLTSALLIAHATCQLPLGVLLDRFGPRRVQAGLYCCSAVGAFVFALGDDVITLTVARAMIGFGFAGSLMSGFKAVVLCLPERQALGNAIIMAGGQTGLVLATWPAEFAVDLFGWRNVFIGLSAATFATALLFLAAVPEWPASGPRERLRAQIAGVGQVFSNATFWRVVPLAAVTAGTYIAIVSLWAGPWFRDVAGLGRDGVATSLTITAVSTVTGIFTTGWIADRLARRGVGLLATMNGFLVLFVLAEIAIMLGLVDLMYPAWIVFAFTGQVAILSYPWLAAYFGVGASGRAHTAVNLSMFAYAFLVQAGIGAVIDLFPPVEGGGYDPRGYTVSFAVLIAIQLATFVWYALGRRRLPAFPASRG